MRTRQSDDDFVVAFVDFLVDDFAGDEEPDEPDASFDVEEPDSFDELEPESFDDDDESADDDELSEPLDELADSDDEPDGVVALESRLSVLKKPDPLNVTPTGWKTFLTGRTSPDSGWVYSVRVSSVNACWTSMVSPDSTNL